MNKTQLICLLVTMLMVMFVGAWIHGRSQHRVYVLTHGRMIGEDPIRTTNSIYLVHLGTSLKGYLEQFLSSPTSVNNVALGDSSVGNGTADACVFLRNNRGGRVGIRIKYADAQQKFHILGY